MLRCARPVWRTGDYDGRTALHLAASEGHAPVLGYLLCCGASPHAQDRLGFTPLDDAQREGHVECAQLLRTAMLHATLSGYDELSGVAEAEAAASSSGGAAVRPGAADQLMLDGLLPLEDAVLLRAAFRHLDAVPRPASAAAAGGTDTSVSAVASSPTASPLISTAVAAAEIACASKEQLVATLQAGGLAVTDTLLSPLLRDLPSYFSVDEFVEHVSNAGAPCSKLLQDALTGRLVIPAFDQFIDTLADVYRAVKAMPNDGETMDTDWNKVPHARKINKEKFDASFGMAACSASGQTWATGDCHTGIVLAELTSTLNYCLAQDLRGTDTVHDHVGREPSGRGTASVASL